MATLSTLQRTRRAPVPLLLESFPAPPSHIPPTPTTPNPPPTGPPLTPLPPVPGPSRISEHEQLLLLASLAPRSRRSNYSQAPDSRRQSTVSVGSSSTGHGGQTQWGERTSIASSSGRGPPHASPARDSVASLSSRTSMSSPRARPSTLSPSSAVANRPPSSSSGHADQQLTRMSLSPMPLSDIDDDDAENLPPPVMPSPTLPRASLGASSSSRHPAHHAANESLSLIDVSDILRADPLSDEGGRSSSDDILPPPFLSRSLNQSGPTMRWMPSQSRQQLDQQLSTSVNPDPTPLPYRHQLPSSSQPPSRSLPPLRPLPPPTDPATSTHMRNNSGSGSFSYPTSSKLSPVNALITGSPKTVTTPLSSSLSSSSRTGKPPPLGALRIPSSNSTSPTSTALVGSLSSNYSQSARQVIRPSVSTITQLSNSPSLDSPVPSPALTSTTDSTSTEGTGTPPATQTMKDLRLELRAGRTRSPALREVYGVRSRSRSRAAEVKKQLPQAPPPEGALPPLPPPRQGGMDEDEMRGVGLGFLGIDAEVETKEEKEVEEEEYGKVQNKEELLKGIVVLQTTTVEVQRRHGGKQEDVMTLDELGPLPSAAALVGRGDGRRNSKIVTTTATVSRAAPEEIARMRAASVSLTPPTPPKIVTKAATKTMMRRSLADASLHERVPSPDIATILMATPRPALTKSTSGKRHVSEGARKRVGSLSASGGRSRSRSRGRGGVGVGVRASVDSQDAEAGRRVSEGSARRVNGGNASVRTDDEKRYTEMERVLEGAGSEDEEERSGRGRTSGTMTTTRDGREEESGDSDSSLDLHTPLPHLMLRHGLLSPNSKLLPGAGSRANTPLDGRPGSMLSVMSNTSVMTKSGIIKDERDTPMRRVRHRDGRLLRGGIGLTTGLGWSDSEDEDAPSPLTRRISTLNLSRRSSASSIVPGRSTTTSGARHQHPLARSASSGALLESERSREFDAYEYDDGFNEYDDGAVDRSLEKSGEWAQSQRQRSQSKTSSSQPPTSWSTRSVGSKTTKSSGGGNAGAGPAPGARTSTSSVGSSFSLEVTTPAEDRAKTPSRLRRPSGGAGAATRMRDSSGSSGGHDQAGHFKKSTSTGTVRRAPSKDEVNTPSSTASTLSIPMPATPKDDDGLSALTTTPVPGMKKRPTWDKEKNLPPLPPGGLKKIPSTPHVDAGAGTRGSIGVSMTARYAFPRARTFSSASSAHSTSASTPHAPSAVLGPPTPPAVRPLQLPRARASGGGGDRPAVPVPSVLHSSASRGSLRSPTTSYSGPASPPSAPSSPLPGGAQTGIARPKPRTGTGMVYRSSSSLRGRGRAPIVLSSSTGGSIGRTGGGARPIPL